MPADAQRQVIHSPIVRHNQLSWLLRSICQRLSYLKSSDESLAPLKESRGREE